MYQLASGTPKSAPVDVPAEFEWSRLWRGLAHRRKIFFGVFLGVFALIAVYTLLTPRSYTTHVKLIAGTGASSSPGGGNSANTTLPLLNALLAATGIQSSETYAELFQEAPVAERVIKELGLNMSSTQFLGHVKVKPITNTTLLDLAVTWSNREDAAKIANAFAGAFVDQERQRVSGQADSAIATLSRQVPEAQRAAAESRTALTTYQAENNLADIQTQTQNTINAAATIDAKYNAAIVDRNQAQAQLGAVTSELGHVGPTTGGQTSVAPNPVLGQLQSQLATATVQLQVAQQQYTDQHPTVIALRRQVDEVKRQIATTPATVVAQSNTIANPLFQQLTQQSATLRAQIASDDASIGQLKSQHASFAPQINALPAKASRLFELQRRSKLTEDVLTAIQQKLNDANISKTTALSDVTITQPASAGLAAVHPSRTLNLIVGLIVSLALAAVVALLIEAFDRRIRSAQQIEDELELPVLASVPKLTDLKNSLAVTGAVPLPGGGTGATVSAEEPWLRAMAVESFLQLVTSLRYSSDAERPVRRITITSAMQGDGKSTIALNTAITMAHIEPRVLLIDADLRRPSLHSKLQRENGRGLSDVLVGTARLEDVITSTEHEGLDLLTSGTRTPNSVKLIQSRRFDETMETLLQTYRTIIIDAPALTPVVDAAILATKSDGTVLVVPMDATDSVEVKRAMQKLQSVGANNLLGTVANRVRPSKRETYDDYFWVEPAQKDDRVALS
jgi:succinoglycan biosynthesis transport protein ExoP